MMSSPEEKTVGWADVRIRALAPDSSTFFTVSPNSCMAFLMLSLVYKYCKIFPFRICLQQALAVSRFSHLKKFQVEGVDRGPGKLYLGTKSQDYLLQSLPDLKNSQLCQIWHICSLWQFHCCQLLSEQGLRQGSWWRGRLRWGEQGGWGWPSRWGWPSWRPPSLEGKLGAYLKQTLCEISLTDPSRWEMEYVRTCAAYTGKQVFLINVLRHTHIDYIYIVIEGSEYLRGDLVLEGSTTFQA